MRCVFRVLTLLAFLTAVVLAAIGIRAMPAPLDVRCFVGAFVSIILGCFAGIGLTTE